MKSKNMFSIIELMTVVLIILLLISLIIPVFVDLKMNARSALCKAQLKQMGVLVNSYTSANYGFLPNDQVTDIKPPTNLPGVTQWDGAKYINNELYGNWNGHLLPYIDGLELPDKFSRYAGISLNKNTNGNWEATATPMPVSPKTKMNQGWVVLDEALSKGGYQDLKLFICPETHSNTIDIHVSNTYLGLKVPRISSMLSGFGTGVPCTYLANSLFFGMDRDWSAPSNSYRLDQIEGASQKALLLEGGVAAGSAWGYTRRVYYYLGTMPYEGYDLGIGHPGDCSNRFVNSNKPHELQFQKLNYVHDNYKQFWISNNGSIPAISLDPGYRNTIAEKFNERYLGKAYMVPCTIDSSSYDPPYTIVSYLDPYPDYKNLTKTIFDDFKKANPSFGASFGDFTAFTDDPNEFHYLVGNQNVLFGDGSVSTKDLGWLSVNRVKIGLPVKH